MKMLRWIAEHGLDATSPPESLTEEEERFRHPFSVVQVIDTTLYSFSSPADRQSLVDRIRECLRRGQAVLLRPWPIEEARRMEWSKEGFATLSGGWGSGEAALNAEFDWQSMSDNFPAIRTDSCHNRFRPAD